MYRGYQIHGGGSYDFFPGNQGGPRIFPLEIRGGPRFFTLEIRGGVGFFPRRVMRWVIFDTHNSFNMKCGRLKRCSNALKIDIVCILGVFPPFFGSLLFSKVVRFPRRGGYRCFLDFRAGGRIFPRVLGGRSHDFFLKFRGGPSIFPGKNVKLVPPGTFPIIGPLFI